MTQEYKSLKETEGFKNTPMGFAMTFEKYIYFDRLLYYIDQWY